MPWGCPLPDVFEVLEATWPAARRHRVGPWEVKEGRGGGKRVMAAKPLAAVGAGDIAMAEDAMRDLGQPLLFVLQPKDAALDTVLAENGYTVVDPTLLYLGEMTTAEIPSVTTFDIWPPLQIMRDLWAEDGIGPDRVAVMERVAGPKTSILGRVRDRAAGVLFVGVHDGTAMVHAVVVTQDYRRHGLARHMMQAAMDWARGQGAAQMSLAVTEANTGARSLYSSLGMVEVGRYHYRIKP